MYVNFTPGPTYRDFQGVIRHLAWISMIDDRKRNDQLVTLPFDGSAVGAPDSSPPRTLSPEPGWSVSVCDRRADDVFDLVPTATCGHYHKHVLTRTRVRAMYCGFRG